MNSIPEGRLKLRVRLPAEILAEIARLPDRFAEMGSIA
jgi:hypothetical protein